MIQPEEIALSLYPNHTLKAKHWPNPKGIPLLAMHGWLDNAASFDLLAPLLPQYNIVALDFPGHGHSDHKPQASFFHILDLVVETFLALKALGWDQCALLGHSLGAVVASLMAGTQPERFKHVILLDALGAMTVPAEKTPEQLQHYLNVMLSKKSTSLSRMPTLEKAIEKRVQATPMHPESARLIVERGTLKTQEGYQWSTDPRLLRPQPTQLTEAQNNAFLEAIKAPVLLIRPEPGFPFSKALMKNRCKKVKNLSLKKLQGHHHVHLDDPQSVSALIGDFIQDLA